jgi:hypothetical protein
MPAPFASRAVCVWNRNIFRLNGLLPGGLGSARHFMFLTVAIMSITFLTEVEFFILIGMF